MNLQATFHLTQEIDFIHTVNKWVDQKYLPEDKYKHVHIEEIVMERDLDLASKFDRSEDFIKDMMAYGEEKAGKLFK